MSIEYTREAEDMCTVAKEPQQGVCKLTLNGKNGVMNERLSHHVTVLMQRHPSLAAVEKDFVDAYLLMEQCYLNGKKLLVAGNGGSAADSEHVTGELMKRFRLKRPVDPAFAERLRETDPVRGAYLADSLEKSLTAIPLVAHEALVTACINDVSGKNMFAQQLFGFGQEGDVFLAISTSGNSENVLYAAVVARAMGIKVIGLTGAGGGKLVEKSDIIVRVPETETYMIQELHLPIYHSWCLMLEERFFGGRQD